MDIVIPVGIYIIVPLIGVILFFTSAKKLKPANNQSLFFFKLLTSFALLGGLIILLLTTLFWKWSGLASIGTGFLVLVGPIAMGLIAYDSFQKKSDTAEKTLFNMAISYFGFLTFVLLISFFVGV